jgi:hypothetical protein
MLMEPSACWRQPSGFHTTPVSSAITTRFTRTGPVLGSTAASAIVALHEFAYRTQATPTPPPVGERPGFHPNRLAAVSSPRRIRGPVRFFNRNSTGSAAIREAMMPMWDSRAKVLLFTEGARHGPTGNGCMPGGFPPCHPPAATVR